MWRIISWTHGHKMSKCLISVIVVSALSYVYSIVGYFINKSMLPIHPS